MADRDEVAYAVIEPHFDAVRDHFAGFVTTDGSLERVKRTRLLVSESVRDSDRHYAGCRDDGLLVVVAPQAARLDIDMLVPLLCHELGHAVDFLYPARFAGRRGEPAMWLPDDQKHMAKLRRLWAERSADQVEWDADSIAMAVTGREIRYCGPCMIQCFSQSGRQRPPGLR